MLYGIYVAIIWLYFTHTFVIQHASIVQYYFLWTHWILERKNYRHTEVQYGHSIFQYTFCISSLCQIFVLYRNIHCFMQKSVLVCDGHTDVRLIAVTGCVFEWRILTSCAPVCPSHDQDRFLPPGGKQWKLTLNDCKQRSPKP